MEFCLNCGDYVDGPLIGAYCWDCWDDDSPAEEAPPPPLPIPGAVEVEAFGVGRRDDGKTTYYFRRIPSDERVAALRSMPYADYLETPEWFNVRMCALEAAGNRCEVCNSDDLLEVHHRTYDRRGRELLEDVTVLCRQCHAEFHTSGRDLAVAVTSPPPPQRVRMEFPETLTPEMEDFLLDYGR